MNRRGFLGSIFAAGIAPAIVRVGSLMAVRPVAVEVTGVGILATIEQIKMQILANATPIELLIGERMRLTRELIAYGALTTEDRIVTPNAKDPATIVYRRWLPYKDVVA